MTIGVSNNIMALYQSQLAAQTKEPSPNCAQVRDEIKNKPLTRGQKTGIGISSALGLCASIMLLAKLDKNRKYSINPLKMFKGGIKNSYLRNGEFKAKEVITMGLGSILGGLAGGEIFGDKKDRNSRLKEGIVQITNIAFPIAFVETLSHLGNKLASSTMPNWCASKNILKQAATKLPATIGTAIGLIGGMFLGNKISNKVNEKIFNTEENRPMKWKDFSAHVDDIGVAATFIAPDNLITKAISRLIPAALFVPGYETGTKQ